MGFTSEDVGSGVGEIYILCLGCHCTDDKLRGDFPLRFLPPAWIVTVFGRIMGDMINLVVLSIMCVIFLLPLP